MCMTCVTTAQAAIAELAIGAYAVKPAVHRALARAGLAAAPDPVAHDVRTVAFLRSLDLDPIEILGAAAVVAADHWVAAPAPLRGARDGVQPSRSRRSWRPSQSHIRIARA
jgi:hypothetical protein